MALSGTTLTVTTLSTAGLLTNNTSGQISSVTGSGLAALLGGAPVFTGLTLSGLVSTLLKTNGSGVIVAAAAGSDYQAVMSAGSNISLVSNVIATSTTPTFSSLTISGTLSALLKTNGAGLVSAATVNVDYQAALTAGTNVTLISNTIAVSTTPAFAALLCTTVGTQNTISGTNAGANLSVSGTGSNVFTGYNAGSAVTLGGSNVAVGPLAMSNGTAMTAAVGNNIAVGPSALLNLSGVATSNIGIGALAGSTLTTGIGNFYAGQAVVASAPTVNYEAVISVGSAGATGYGTNTMRLCASAGVYFNSPGYWFGYAQFQIGGTIGWNVLLSKSIALKSGDNTQVTLNSGPGIYRCVLSGSIYTGTGSTVNINQYVNGAVYLNSPSYYYNSTGSISWTAVNITSLVSASNSTTYIQYAIAGSMQTSTGAPLLLTIEYYSTL